MTIKHKEVLPMYNLSTLKRKISKDGLQATVDFLLSDDLPLNIKDDLTKVHVFNADGYLCLSLLYAL